MGFREALSLGTAAFAGLPVRALAGWVLSLLGLALSVMVVVTWLAGPRLAGRHRSGGRLHASDRPAPPSSWVMPHTWSVPQAGPEGHRPPWPGRTAVRHRFETVGRSESRLSSGCELPAVTGPARAEARSGGSAPPWDLARTLPPDPEPAGVTPAPRGGTAGVAGPADARAPADLLAAPDARAAAPDARAAVPGASAPAPGPGERWPHPRYGVPDVREQAPDAAPGRREPREQAPGAGALRPDVREREPGAPARGPAAAERGPDAREGAGEPGRRAETAGPGGRRSSEPAIPGAGAGAGPAADEPDGEVAPVLSPAALRQLGVRRRGTGAASTAGGLVQRLPVTLGNYIIEVLLAEAPAGDRTRRSGKEHTWITSAPYLVWTPLPHDFPASGVAFACVGAGEEGCLFLDLAAAPGAIALGGDPAAATRLAESLAHQLCAGPAAARVSVLIVGSALPPPPPLGAEWIASVADLPGRRPDPAREVEIVFCRLDSNDDVFPLARYVKAAPYRVVPLVLADLPDAPWSFTAHPSPHPAPVLQPVVS